MRAPLVIMQGTVTFSRVCTEDSDLPISCDIKDEPAFKSLQGNPVFFHVRASRCPFHFRQQTHGVINIPIAETSFPLRCLWKVGIPLVLKPDSQL